VRGKDPFGFGIMDQALEYLFHVLQAKEPILPYVTVTGLIYEIADTTLRSITIV
jgi:hypothetical protein